MEVNWVLTFSAAKRAKLLSLKTWHVQPRLWRMMLNRPGYSSPLDGLRICPSNQTFNDPPISAATHSTSLVPASPRPRSPSHAMANYVFGVKPPQNQGTGPEPGAGHKRCLPAVTIASLSFRPTLRVLTAPLPLTCASLPTT